MTMTTKQSIAITKMVENGGNASKAMLEAGYSKAMAHNPQKLTQSKAYKSTMSKLAKANNVTIEQYMMNLGLGMTAMKQNNYTGEITTDITTRLSANKQAERFLFDDDKTSKPINSKELKEAITKGNVKELNQVVFKTE